MSISPSVETGRDPGAREPLGERWIQFIQASLTAGRQVRHLLAQVGIGWHLSDAELLLLWTFSQDAPEGHRESDLAGPLGLSSGQLSAALYDLRDRGLISFRLIPGDDAPQPITLTSLGHSALNDILRTVTPAAQAWDSQATAEELDACIQLLRRLTTFSHLRGTRRARSLEPRKSTPLARTTRGAA
jgi:DNA-binding MarR family transcriptional regulator